MYIPEGRRHCPNFLWGLPASAASCRLPPLSDRVGLRSCCWLLVCMRKNQAVNARNAVLSSFVHWSESLFYFKKGRKQVGKQYGPTLSTMGKKTWKWVKRIKVSERVTIAHHEERKPDSLGSVFSLPSLQESSTVIPSTPGSYLPGQGRWRSRRESGAVPAAWFGGSKLLATWTSVPRASGREFSADRALR